MKEYLKGDGGSIYEDDNCSGKVEQVQSVNVITSQMQSDRKQLAEGEQNVNQEGSTHFIRFQESVNVDVPNSPKTISDSSKSEKEHAVFVNRKLVNLFGRVLVPEL
ncbi:hypothetical protein DINM_006158 [Dirofilaria immitis]|nr:hypothetical protein [Dirofilaria immitis]